jgi:hypothetical protein
LAQQTDSSRRLAPVVAELRAEPHVFRGLLESREFVFAKKVETETLGSEKDRRPAIAPFRARIKTGGCTDLPPAQFSARLT